MWRMKLWKWETRTTLQRSGMCTIESYKMKHVERQ